MLGPTLSRLSSGPIAQGAISASAKQLGLVVTQLDAIVDHIGSLARESGVQGQGYGFSALAWGLLSLYHTGLQRRHERRFRMLKRFLAKTQANSLLGSHELELAKYFRVVKKLGQGGYSSVYMAERLSDHQRYALKVTNVYELTPEVSREVVGEIRLLASLEHPNLVQYHEAFVDHGRLCIVTELMGGGDLATALLQRRDSMRRFSEDSVWSAFLQVALALQYLHHAHVVHRDVKPANVLVAQDGTLKLADLGIAEVLDKVFTTAASGTPHYMPPEFWKAQRCSYSTDVWALGCVLHELCALRPLFPQREQADLELAVLSGELPPLPSRYSADLGQIRDWLLTPDPGRRPTMDEVLADPRVKAHLCCLPEPLRREASSGSLASAADAVVFDRRIEMPEARGEWDSLNDVLPPARYKSGGLGVGDSIRRSHRSQSTGDLLALGRAVPTLPSATAAAAAAGARQPALGRPLGGFGATRQGSTQAPTPLPHGNTLSSVVGLHGRAHADEEEASQSSPHPTVSVAVLRHLHSSGEHGGHRAHEHHALPHGPHHVPPPDLHGVIHHPHRPNPAGSPPPAKHTPGFPLRGLARASPAEHRHGFDTSGHGAMSRAASVEGSLGSRDGSLREGARTLSADELTRFMRSGGSDVRGGSTPGSRRGSAGDLHGLGRAFGSHGSLVGLVGKPASSGNLVALGSKLGSAQNLAQVASRNAPSGGGGGHPSLGSLGGVSPASRSRHQISPAPDGSSHAASPPPGLPLSSQPPPALPVQLGGLTGASYALQPRRPQLGRIGATGSMRRSSGRFASASSLAPGDALGPMPEGGGAEGPFPGVAHLHGSRTDLASVGDGPSSSTSASGTALAALAEDEPLSDVPLPLNPELHDLPAHGGSRGDLSHPPLPRPRSGGGGERLARQ